MSPDKEKVTIDFITLDQKNDEYVMYLVENGPWGREALEDRMRAIQARIYGAVDVALDGHLAQKHPESRGRSIRVQVDLHDEAPGDVDALISRLAAHITASEEYVRDVEASGSVKELRIVSKRL